MSVASRVLSVEGLYNLRDVGGYRAGSQRTAWNRLLRSDGLHHLTETGRAQFAGLGISTVLDLRDDLEREHSPSLVAPGTNIVPTPIFQGATQSVRDGLTLEDFTLGLFQGYGPSYALALRRIALAEEGPVLVHCTAGKDRTGTLVALALTLVGVDRDQVLEDYAATEAQLAGAWLEQHVAMVRSFGVTVTPALLRLMGGSPAETLEQALNWVEREHGSVLDYVRAAGLTEAELLALQRRLLDT